MKTHILRALSEKSFRYLWIGEVFTQIAANLFNFFLILVVYSKTHSNTAVSGVVISFTVPAILFGSIAGVYVDRWSKKDVLIISNLIRAVLFIFLAFFLRNLLMVYFFSFLIAVITQFFIPAETPIIPQVVKPKHLLSANALFGMGIYGSIMAAYVLSGPLLLWFGEKGTLFVLAAMLIAGAIAISFIATSHVRKKQHILPNFRQTIQDIHHTLVLMSRSKEIAHSLFLLALSQILILVVATISPGYATQILGIRLEDFPLLFVAPAALGMVIGAIVLVNVFHSHSKDRVINTGMFLSGLAMLFLPYGSKVTSRDFIQSINLFLPGFLRITILHIMILLAFILGVANALVFVPANTILQEKTDDESRGKIYGLLNTIVGVASFSPIIIVGGLSDLFGVGAVITGIGVCLLVLGVVRMYL